MKVIKDNEHSVMVKAFNIAEKDYLSITTMLYYDLIEEKLLTEQDMWTETSTFLRTNQPLDELLPKICGEFIAYGDCFSKIPTIAKRVSIQVGELEKSLDVIGDRQYYKNSLGVLSISEPKEFNRLRVGFENAYGGEELELNPIGKGYYKDKENLNEKSLHNIDTKSHKSESSSKEKTIPQSFEPISMSWNPRRDKMGTFDDKWFKERWPYYPNDLDKSFFNTALEDQRIEGYFNGNEKIIIKNMNEKYSIIDKSLPNKKIKTFVTKIEKDNYYEKDIKKEDFIEIENRIDTIIIFTNIAKVVIVHRSVIETADDEYSDIKELFIDTVLDDQEYDIRYYKEKKDRKIDKSFNVESIEDDMKRLSENILDIPRRLNLELLKLKNKVLNIGPSYRGAMSSGLSRYDFAQNKFKNIAHNGIYDFIKRYYPSEVRHLQSSNGYNIYKRIDNNLKVRFERSLNELEKSKFTKEIKDLENMNTKIDSELKEKEKVFQDKLDSAKDEINNNKNSSDILKDKKDEFNNLGKEKISDKYDFKNIDSIKNKTWEDYAKDYIGDLSLDFKYNKNKYKDLQKIGLRDLVIDLSLITYNSNNKYINKKEWEIDKDFNIPEGFLIPISNENILKKLIIRPNIIEVVDDKIKLKGSSEDIQIEGSSDCEIVFEGVYKEAVVICSDIIEAWILNQDLYDIATIVVFKTEEEFINSDFFNNNRLNLKYIISTNFNFIQQKEEEFIKEEVLIDNEWFIEDYDSYSFRLKVINLFQDENYKRELIAEEIKKKKMGIYYSPSYRTSFAKELSQLMSKELNREMNKNIESVKSSLIKSQSEIYTVFRDIDRETRRMTNDKNKFSKKVQLEKSKTLIKNTFNDTFSTLNQNIADGKNKKHSLTQLKPDKIMKRIQSNINIIKGELGRIKDKSFENSRREALKSLNDIYQSIGITKIRSLDRRLKNMLLPMERMKENGPFSEKVNEEFKNNLNIDPKMHTKDLVLDYIDEILDHYNKNDKQFDYYKIEDLEVTDVDLSYSSFKNSKLRGTHFKRVNFFNCDFTNADLTEVVFEDCILDKSVFVSCKFFGTKLLDSSLIESDLSKAMIKGVQFLNVQLTKSVLSQTLFINSSIEKSNLSDSIFEDITFQHILIRDSELSNTKLTKFLFSNMEILNSNFTKSFFSRGGFLTSNINKADFSNANFESVLFHKDCKLEEINAVSSMFSKSSILETIIEKSNFNNSKFMNLNINSSHLLNSQFVNCEAPNSCITRSRIEDSDLSRSDYMSTSFRRTFFKNVNFSRSNLYSADLFNIRVNKLNLKNSNIKKTILETIEKVEYIEEIEY